MRAKLFYLIVILFLTSCSSSGGLGSVGNASAPLGNSASSSSSSSKILLDKDGRYKIDSNYVLDGATVRIGSVAILPKGVWVGVAFTGSGDKNLNIDLKSAKATVDDQTLEIDATKSDAPDINGQPVSESVRKGTLYFPTSPEDLPLSQDSHSRIKLALGSLYDPSTGNKVEDIEVDIDLN